MKYDATPNNVRQKRQPLRTITELADEFGLPVMSLVKLMSGSEDAPKHELKVQSRNRSNATWYNPTGVRAWWKQFLIDRPDVREKLNK